ncbi:hypothetical protein FOA52_004091 [Chlamydomonas sp. UWO 241]|nr:hypothetical protein FOA52_004091 [Chlamydomonas sp. UWO 241]
MVAASQLASAADEAAAATAFYHAVLLSPDPWLVVFPCLDRGSKVALRGVCAALRRQVDGAMQVLASPAAGFYPDDLAAALVRWPAVKDLTLVLVVGSSASDLAPLATTTLAGLKSLAVRQAYALDKFGAHEHLPALEMALSSSVGASLQVLDISGCRGLSSIDIVRSCMQLRSLRMPGCCGVSDLSPLAACSETLEELWMAENDQVVSLAPLQACTQLRKLDLLGCLSELHNQVEDLWAYPQLADPFSVRLEGLVQRLQANIPPDMQRDAAESLSCISICGDKDAIAASGALPALVQLLVSAANVHRADAFCCFWHATTTLRQLASNHAGNQATIAAAGAIPALVHLLGHTRDSDVQGAAAATLGNLAGSAHNLAAITAAGAIPALWQLLHSESIRDSDVRTEAALALDTLVFAGAAPVPEPPPPTPPPPLQTGQARGLLAELTAQRDAAQAELADVKKELAEVKRWAAELVADAGACNGAAAGPAGPSVPPALPTPPPQQQQGLARQA